MIKIKYLRKIYLFKKKISIKKFIKTKKKKINNIYLGGYINKKIFNLNYKIKKNIKLNLIKINSYLGKKIINKIFEYIIKKSIKKILINSCLIKYKNINNIYIYKIKYKNKINKKILLKIKKYIYIYIKKKINKNIKIKKKIKNNNFIIINKNNKKKKIFKIKLIKKYLLFYKIKNILNIKSKNKNIQKIYIKIKKKKNIFKKYLKNNKKIKNNDHRIINKQLNFYHINKNTPGIIFWNYKGFILLENIKKLLRKIFYKYNYIEVQSACLINKNMWKNSGHWNYYNNFIFTTKSEKKELCIKPMNCLGHIDIYKQKIQSYKNLPIRIAEFGICHRNEYSGSLCGLMRTRSFTQDDAHIFCSKNQIKKEISKCIDMINKVYKIFKFKNINIFVSTKPIKYLGTKKIWKKSENKLIEVLKEKKIKFKINKGEGAFYGPKIEFILKDASNKEWQCGTIQLDFYLSKKLNINFFDKKNIKKKPIIIHRAILGSLERFIGILLEKNNGWLPTWLTPIQIVIMNISKKHKKYCKKILFTLKKNNIRVISDFENKKINYKIRKHTLQKIPYMIVCGDKEVLSNTISIRKTLNNKFFIMKIKQVIEKFKKKNKY